MFRGFSLGADGSTVGEIVFNTAMTGYQEILTDPSYHSQIVTLTYPHVGNTGVNPEDIESPRVFAAGIVVRDVPSLMSNFRATQSLPDYLRAAGTVAIGGVDTRKLTRILRERGAQSACIASGNDVEAALAAARNFAGIAGRDLTREVTVQTATPWNQGAWQLGHGYPTLSEGRHHVVAIDYGVKYNLLRLLAARDCRVTLLPAHSTAAEVLALEPQGIFLSNGPGDPAACQHAVTAIQEFVERKIPLFGICLGQQLLGLALGGRTVKMKFGHHGANHPVQDLDTGRVYITSQNHGFELDADSLPANARVTHRSLFDGSLQGFELTDRPAFGFQGHPEASPGPHDTLDLFDRFISSMAR